MSLSLTLGGYGVGVFAFDDAAPRLVLGGAIGLGAGIAKELWDLAGAGDASWRDVFWDVVGVASGLLLAFTIDCLVGDACGARSP